MSDTIRRRPKPNPWRDLTDLQENLREIAMQAGYTGKIRFTVDMEFHRGGLLQAKADVGGNILQIMTVVQQGGKR
jgi:hypothetical protein